MHKKTVRLRILSLLIASLLIVVSPTPANAYVLNGWVISDPTDIQYKIGGNVGQYASMIISCTETWETYCPEVTVICAADQNIYFYGDLSVSNGTYAVCRHYSNEKSIITFYQSFANASAIVQQETIVHEVGHSLGLAHCDSGKESISVMRESGFNGKAYPLSDDIAGIADLYG